MTLRQILKKLRHVWHEAYYKVVPKSVLRWEWTCQQVTEAIDLGKPLLTWQDRLRFYLHMSMCQACRYYRDTSVALRRAIRELLNLTSAPRDLRFLNDELLKKFARKHPNDQS